MTRKVDPRKYELFDGPNKVAPVPSTRGDLPATSHAAALKARKSSSRVARAVLESLYAMRESAGVKDQTLEEMLKKFPSSSVRARRSDLVKLGHVEETGNTATTRSGSPCKTWRITKSGIELVESQGVSS